MCKKTFDVSCLQEVRQNKQSFVMQLAMKKKYKWLWQLNAVILSGPYMLIKEDIFVVKW